MQGQSVVMKNVVFWEADIPCQPLTAKTYHLQSVNPREMIRPTSAGSFVLFQTGCMGASVESVYDPLPSFTGTRTQASKPCRKP